MTEGHETHFIPADRKTVALTRPEPVRMRRSARLRAYNYADRYIRHDNNALRIDPIATAQEKADATFRDVTP